jgi:hypothetical protein
MSRVEENRKLVEWVLSQAKNQDTHDQLIINNLGIIASVLLDISKSLAILADLEDWKR